MINRMVDVGAIH